MCKACRLFLVAFIFSAVFTSTCSADSVTARYIIGADTFQDSNSNPPNFPSTTTVRGGFSFTFDRAISETAIVPDSVAGIEIRDNNNVLHVYDTTNSGVYTDVNPFLETARITFGGNTSTPPFMVGLSDDFRVTFDIDTVTGDVTNIHDNFSYISTVDPFYTSQSNIVLLSSYNVVDADLDDDGDIDGHDFLIIQRTDPSLIPAWESQYPGSPGPSAQSLQQSEIGQAVPEPTALVLCLTALAMGTSRVQPNYTHQQSYFKKKHR